MTLDKHNPDRSQSALGCKLKLTYLEQELAVDALILIELAYGLRQIFSELFVLSRLCEKMLRIEFFKARHVHGSEVFERDHFLITSQDGPHELHVAVVERRHVILALDCDDVVDVILRTHERLQFIKVHLGRSSQFVAGDCSHDRFPTRLIGRVQMTLVHHMCGILHSLIIAYDIWCGLVITFV